MRDVIVLSHVSTLNDSRRFRTAQSLTNAGYDVTVIEKTTPATEQRPQRERIGGITIQRFRLRLPSGKVWRLARAAEYFLRMGALSWKARRGPAVFHCHNLTTLPLGFLAGRFRDPVIYDSAELWTEMPGMQRMPLLRWVSIGLERLLSRWTACNIQADELRADFFAQYHGVPRPLVLNNTCEVTMDPHTDAKPDVLRSSLGIGRGTKIMLYVGGIRPYFHLEEVIQALSRLPGWSLVLLGHELTPGYIQVLRQAATSQGVHNRVYWQPAVPSSEVPCWVAGADLTVCLMRGAGKSYEFSVPTKVYTSIALGVPVIASRLPGLDRLYEQFQVGPQVSSVTADAIVEAVGVCEQQYDHYVHECVRAAQVYQWATDEVKLLHLYGALHSSTAAPQ